ncbi:MAG: NAD(P)H-dependent oxidoreductase [Bacilli bacterium]|nr:NAD(P)H-dependent oxidoreductase [Bacilli bacterium]
MMKSIVIYFSRADENYSVGYVDKGNTEVIAEYIKDITGADLFKVERKVPYAKDYMTCIEEAKIEKQNNERPELVNTLESIDDYDVVYIGSPIYWGTMPQPMFTQLEKLNWNGKTVRIFTTHEGSGLANVPSDVKRICVGANVLDNSLAIQGSSVYDAKEKVENWINS